MLNPCFAQQTELSHPCYMSIDDLNHHTMFATLHTRVTLMHLYGGSIPVCPVVSHMAQMDIIKARSSYVAVPSVTSNCYITTHAFTHAVTQYGCCRQDMIYKRLYNGNVVLRSLCGIPPLHPLGPHSSNLDATAATAVATHLRLHQGTVPPYRLWDIAHVLKQHAQCTVEAAAAASARASASASSPAAGPPAATTESQSEAQADGQPMGTAPPVQQDRSSMVAATAATGEPRIVVFVLRRLASKLAYHFESLLTPVE